MSQHFTCRNGHRWGLSVEGAAINGRWVYCPVCGAAPKPASPMPRWKRCAQWVRRNPAVVGLLASVVVMLATFALAATMWEAHR
jgi:hypothetical protein